MLYSLYKEIIFIDCLHLLHYHFLLAFGRQNFLRSKRTYSLSSILSWNDFYRLFLGKKFINSSLVNFQISFWQFMVSLFNFAVNKTSSKLSLRIHMHVTVNRLLIGYFPVSVRALQLHYWMKTVLFYRWKSSTCLQQPEDNFSLVFFEFCSKPDTKT